MIALRQIEDADPIKALLERHHFRVIEIDADFGEPAVVIQDVGATVAVAKSLERAEWRWWIARALGDLLLFGGFLGGAPMFERPPPREARACCYLFGASLLAPLDKILSVFPELPSEPDSASVRGLADTLEIPPDVAYLQLSTAIARSGPGSRSQAVARFLAHRDCLAS